MDESERGPGRPALDGRLTTGRSPRIDFRLPPALYDELVAYARAEDTPISVIIRRALAHYLGGNE